jgi:hypothetical protein
MKTGLKLLLFAIGGLVVGSAATLAITGAIGKVSAAERVLGAYPVDLINMMYHSHNKSDVLAGQTAPTLKIELVADPMKMRNYSLHLITDHFRFAPEDASGPAVFGEGHAHVYIDDVLLGRAYGPWYHIPQLKPGPHTLYVTLNHNDHNEYSINGATVGAQLAFVVK